MTLEAVETQDCIMAGDIPQPNLEHQQMGKKENVLLFLNESSFWKG